MGKVQESDFKLRARSYWQACELQEPEIRKSVFVLCLPPDLHDLLTLLFSGIRFSSSVSKDWLSLRVNWRSQSQFCAVSPVKTPVKIANIPVTQFQNYRKEILIN